MLGQAFAAIGHRTAGPAGPTTGGRTEKQSPKPVTKHQTPIDQRPFRSKADQEREMALQTKYQRLAIPEVVAALQQTAGAADKDSADRQMG